MGLYCMQCITTTRAARKTGTCALRQSGDELGKSLPGWKWDGLVYQQKLSICTRDSQPTTERSRAARQPDYFISPRSV